MKGNAGRKQLITAFHAILHKDEHYDICYSERYGYFSLDMNRAMMGEDFLLIETVDQMMDYLIDRTVMDCIFERDLPSSTTGTLLTIEKAQKRLIDTSVPASPRCRQMNNPTVWIFWTSTWIHDPNHPYGTSRHTAESPVRL